MKKPPIPKIEKERLDELRSFEVLDTTAEEEFDEFTKLAAEVCGTSIALISLVDEARQWFKSSVGLDASETPRDLSFCGHAILSDDLFYIEDAFEDDRFKDNPLVTGAPHVRFYAGAPLVTSNGMRIGTLCAIDSDKKTLNDAQKHTLTLLAKNIVRLLELKRMNKDLKFKEQEYLSVQKIAKTGHWELCLKTGVTKWSEEIFKIHGIDSRTPVHKVDAVSFYPEHERGRIESCIDNCINGAKSFDDVFEFIDAKDRLKWVRSKGEPVFGKDGKVESLRGLFQDVTENYERERIDRAVSKVRKSFIKTGGGQSFYKKLLDIILDLTRSEFGFIGEVLEDEQGKYLKTYSLTDISWNEDTRKLYNEFASTGMEFRSLDSLFGYVIKNGEPYISNSPSDDEHAKGVPNGHPDLKSFFGMPIVNNGKTIAMIGVANRCGGYPHKFIEKYEHFTNVLGEILAIEKLELIKQESEVQTRIILESTGVALWTYYPKSQRLVWDEGMFKLYGVSNKRFDYSLDFWKERLHEEDLSEFLNDLDCSSPRKGEIDSVYRIVTGKSKIKYIKTKAQFVRNEYGEVVKIFGSNWDCTKDVRYNNLLIEARDRAEQFAKAKSEFLANMSHEIRTPMNGVLGMVAMLSETRLTNDQVDMVSTIKSCGDSLLTILNDILDFSKIESGRMDLEIANFSLDKCIDETVSLFSLSKGYGAKVEVIKGAGLPDYVMGDVVRIKQILANLISNALKFSPAGESVTFKSELISSGEFEKVKFSIIDKGIGISKEDQKKLFIAFSQADTSITRRFGGTGLGLSICSKLAELMGAQINVESSPGNGSTFEITIPLKLGNVQEGVADADQEQGSLSRKFPHSILVVEDNVINQKLARMMLGKLGYECDIAENGEVAIDMMRSGEYTLVFMDMQMPVMDGITATRSIIKEMGLGAPPIIAMTANVLSEDRHKCHEAGMVDFLSKPVKLENMKNIIHRHSS